MGFFFSFLLPFSRERFCAVPFASFVFKDASSFSNCLDLSVSELRFAFIVLLSSLHDLIKDNNFFAF